VPKLDIKTSKMDTY